MLVEESVGFRAIEGYLATLQKISTKNSDEERALRIAENLAVAFYMEGFVNDILERYLEKNADAIVNEGEPKTISKIRLAIEDLKIKSTNELDLALGQLTKLFRERNKIVHPQSYLNNNNNSKKLTSTAIAFLTDIKEFNKNHSAKNTIREAIINESDYQYPEATEFRTYPINKS